MSLKAGPNRFSRFLAQRSMDAFRYGGLALAVAPVALAVVLNDLSATRQIGASAAITSGILLLVGFYAKAPRSATTNAIGLRLEALATPAAFAGLFLSSGPDLQGWMLAIFIVAIGFGLSLFVRSA